MGCFSGCLMTSASNQKLFCEICSAFSCSFDEFVGEKVVSPSYSSAIFLSPPSILFELLYDLCCSVTQLCLTLCDPMDCSLPGSSVRGISQVRILEWVVISFSKGSSQPRDWTQVSCTAGRSFTIWATSQCPFEAGKGTETDCGSIWKKHNPAGKWIWAQWDPFQTSVLTAARLC